MDKGLKAYNELIMELVGYDLEIRQDTVYKGVNHDEEKEAYEIRTIEDEEAHTGGYVLSPTFYDIVSLVYWWNTIKGILAEERILKSG